MPTRCTWVPVDDSLYVAYHDEEWGVPEHDDRRLFELLTLEGAQAGLSWATILHKRDGYRQAFAGFDPAAVGRFTKRDVERLMREPAIVRNRLKIESAVNNAARVLEVQDADGSFDAYAWRFAGQPDGRELSKDLKRRGFRFVGPTVCYAFMQAAGLVNDHDASCFRRRELN